MSLLDTLRGIFRRNRLPLAADDEDDVKGNTVGYATSETPALAHTLTAEALGGILREAEGGETERLFALYRDMRLSSAHVQAITNQRQLAVLTKTLNIVPADSKNALDIAAAEAASILTNTPSWLTGFMLHNIKGHLYPLAVQQRIYKPAPVGSRLRFVPHEWRPVPYRLLDFTDGCLKIWDADPVTGARLGTKRTPEPMRHIVHRGHLLSDIPDNWGGPLRAALFWWLFATMDRDWWVRFLDRFGAPFIVGRYDTSDTSAKSQLVRAFSAATKLFGLVVSKETDIEVQAVASNSHGEAFENMQTFANGELSKLILGQTMTVTAQASGLGGGAQAEVQENTLGDIEVWDLIALASTANAEIALFLEVNGLPGRAVLQVSTDNVKEMTAKTALLEAATKAGLQLTDEGIDIISKAGGLPFQRAAAAPPAFGLAAFTAAHPRLLTEAALIRSGQPTNSQLDLIAQRGAPALAAAFQGRFATVPDLIAASTSAEDLEARLVAHFSTLPPARISALLEEALNAYAATGSASGRFSN